MKTIAMCKTTTASNEMPLDTIRNFCGISQEKALTPSHRAFSKRRNAKRITKAKTAKLMALQSSENGGYRRAYNCAEYLYQEGDKITSNYCKHRSCNVCNRIKSAQMLSGYAKPLLELADKHQMYLVTLTAPNVVADELSNEIDRMQQQWKRLRDRIRYMKLPMFGMRKIECTYNRRTFNPHYHVLITSEATAKEMIRYWLEINPTSSAKAQDYRKADKNALYELFKYISKSVVGGEYSATDMDTIFRAMHGRNSYYRIGIKKYASEEMETLISRTIDFKGSRVDVWKWANGDNDWLTADGEKFVDLEMSNKAKNIVKIIEKAKTPQHEKLTESEVYANIRRNRPTVIF